MKTNSIVAVALSLLVMTACAPEKSDSEIARDSARSDMYSFADLRERLTGNLVRVAYVGSGRGGVYELEFEVRAPMMEDHYAKEWRSLICIPELDAIMRRHEISSVSAKLMGADRRLLTTANCSPSQAAMSGSVQERAATDVESASNRLMMWAMGLESLTKGEVSPSGHPVGSLTDGKLVFDVTLSTSNKALMRKLSDGEEARFFNTGMNEAWLRRSCSSELKGIMSEHSIDEVRAQLTNSKGEIQFSATCNRD